MNTILPLLAHDGMKPTFNSSLGPPWFTPFIRPHIEIASYWWPRVNLSLTLPSNTPETSKICFFCFAFLTCWSFWARLLNDDTPDGAGPWDSSSWCPWTNIGRRLGRRFCKINRKKNWYFTPVGHGWHFKNQSVNNNLRICVYTCLLQSIFYSGVFYNTWILKFNYHCKTWLEQLEKGGVASLKFIVGIRIVTSSEVAPQGIL